jgi:hypothetical protein
LTLEGVAATEKSEVASSTAASTIIKMTMTALAARRKESWRATRS